jgi:hypothetical protein
MRSFLPLSGKRLRLRDPQDYKFGNLGADRIAMAPIMKRIGQ